MIDEYNANRTGWARVSDDRKLRYRLARALTPRGAAAMELGLPFPAEVGFPKYAPTSDIHAVSRIVFVMLNPSTADAFKPDRTVDKCVLFAQRWGADILEVVNLFALISTDPRGLDTAWALVGAGEVNDAQILEACRGATRVIAAWGNHGARNERDVYVRKMLVDRAIRLEHLGITKEGHPTHPLARGKAFIPLTREPEVWAP